MTTFDTAPVLAGQIDAVGQASARRGLTIIIITIIIIITVPTLYIYIYMYTYIYVLLNYAILY